MESSRGCCSIDFSEGILQLASAGALFQAREHQFYGTGHLGEIWSGTASWPLTWNSLQPPTPGYTCLAWYETHGFATVTNLAVIGSKHLRLQWWDCGNGFLPRSYLINQPGAKTCDFSLCILTSIHSSSCPLTTQIWNDAAAGSICHLASAAQSRRQIWLHDYGSRKNL